MTYEDFKNKWMNKYIDGFTILREKRVLELRDALANGAAVVFTATARKVVSVQLWDGIAERGDDTRRSRALQCLVDGICLGGSYAGKSFAAVAAYCDKNGKLRLQTCSSCTKASDTIKGNTEYFVITNQYDGI